MRTTASDADPALRRRVHGDGSWRVVAASVRGRRHARQGEACQDHHVYRVTPGGFLVAAIADGAGSAERAGDGAEIAAREAVRSLIEGCGRGEADSAERAADAVTRSVGAANRAVRAEALARRSPAGEFATTLIAVLASESMVAVAHIGDGAVVIDTDAGGLECLSEPQAGEHLNETSFVTDDDFIVNTRVAARRCLPEHLAVCSDGLQMLAMRMPEAIPHEPFFAPLFQFCDATGPDRARAELRRWMRSRRVAARTDDDMTLLVATLRR